MKHIMLEILFNKHLFFFIHYRNMFLTNFKNIYRKLKNNSISNNQKF